MTDKYNKITPNGKKYDCRQDPTLNELQLAHLRGEINLYEPVTAQKEDWFHDKKGNNHHPIKGTTIPANLPPIYIQWKDDWRRRRGQQQETQRIYS